MKDSEKKKKESYQLSKKSLLLYVIVSSQPVLWPWSHNSHKWVPLKYWYYIKICYVKNDLNPIGNNAV